MTTIEPGAPPGPKAPKIRLNVEVPQDLGERLDARAAEFGVTRTACVILILRAALGLATDGSEQLLLTPIQPEPARRRRGGGRA